MNATAARRQAINFRQTADDLWHLWNVVRLGQDPTGKTSVLNEKQKTLRMEGYLDSYLILIALAAEVMLKALSFIKTGKYKRIHDLKFLYDNLHPDTKGIVNELAHSRGFTRLEETFEKNKNVFLDWRYKMEAGSIRAEPSALGKALDILIDTYDQLEVSGITENE